MTFYSPLLCSSLLKTSPIHSLQGGSGTRTPVASGDILDENGNILHFNAGIPPSNEVSPPTNEFRSPSNEVSPPTNEFRSPFPISHSEGSVSRHQSHVKGHRKSACLPSLVPVPEKAVLLSETRDKVGPFDLHQCIYWMSADEASEEGSPLLLSHTSQPAEGVSPMKLSPTDPSRLSPLPTPPSSEKGSPIDSTFADSPIIASISPPITYSLPQSQNDTQSSKCGCLGWLSRFFSKKNFFLERLCYSIKKKICWGIISRKHNQPNQPKTLVVSAHLGFVLPPSLP